MGSGGLYLEMTSAAIYTGSTTESQRQTTMRTAGVLANLSVYVIFNGSSGAGTFVTRKSGVSQNLTISFTASTTGLFEDTTHSDTVAAGDIWCFRGNSTSSFVQPSTIALTFTANTNTVSKLGGQVTTSASGFAAPVGGANPALAAETFTKYKAGSAGTMRNFLVNVFTNTLGARTVSTRINGATGNGSLSVPSSTTGVFEDLTHTDTVSASDLLDYSF